MTIGGWIFMSVSLIAVVGLTAVCYGMILSAPQEDNGSDASDGKQ